MIRSYSGIEKDGRIPDDTKAHCWIGVITMAIATNLKFTRPSRSRHPLRVREITRSLDWDSTSVLPSWRLVPEKSCRADDANLDALSSKDHLSIPSIPSLEQEVSSGHHWVYKSGIRSVTEMPLLFPVIAGLFFLTVRPNRTPLAPNQKPFLFLPPIPPCRLFTHAVDWSFEKGDKSSSISDVHFSNY